MGKQKQHELICRMFPHLSEIEKLELHEKARKFAFKQILPDALLFVCPTFGFAVGLLIALLIC